MERLDCKGKYDKCNKKYNLEIQLSRDDLTNQNGNYDLKLCPTLTLPFYGKCRSRSGIFRNRVSINFIIVILSDKVNKDPQQIACSNLIPHNIDTSDIENPKLILSGSLITHGLYPNGKNVGVVVIEETESNFIFLDSKFKYQFKDFKKRVIRIPKDEESYMDKDNFHQFIKEFINSARKDKDFITPPPQAVGNGGVLKPG
jgi:hypothetical protein